MKNLVFKTKYYALYEVIADESTSPQLYDCLKLESDSIWVEPILFDGHQIQSINNRKRLFIDAIRIKFNNNATSMYSIYDSKQIIEEWTEATQFTKMVSDYMTENSWLTTQN